MKRTTILLEEDLLLEVQQLAKEQQITTSQVIQQAVARFVEAQRRGRQAPPAPEQRPIVLPRPPRPMPEPVRLAQERTAAGLVDSYPTLIEEAMETSSKKAPWSTLIPLALGVMSALFALFVIIQAVSHLANHVRPLEIVVNSLVPGLLLGVVATAFLYLANEGRRSGGV